MSSEKKTDKVAAVVVAAALKERQGRGGGKEGERKQGAAERRKAEGASQGIQGRGLSQEKDDDVLPDESPAKRKSKSKKKMAANAEQ